MLITSHVFVGAGLGSRLQPTPAFLVGVASHLAMDALPHWGVGLDGDWLPVARRDGSVGLLAMAAATIGAPPSRKLSVLAGMTGACLPDADKIGRYFIGRSPWPRAVNVFHGRIQREAANRLPYEVATAAILGVAAALLLRAPAGGRAPPPPQSPPLNTPAGERPRIRASAAVDPGAGHADAG